MPNTVTLAITFLWLKIFRFGMKADCFSDNRPIGCKNNPKNIAGVAEPAAPLFIPEDIL